MTKLTDAEIDGLSGTKLGIAVAETVGYTDVIESKTRHGRLFGIAPGESNGRESLPDYHTDKGAALSLLLSVDTSESGLGYGWAIQECDGEVGVYSELQGEPLVTGPKSEIASLCCKAFLKLANRKAE